VLAAFFRYLDPHDWERDGAIYRQLGVHHFRRILPGGYYYSRIVSLFIRRPYRIVKGRDTAGGWVVFTVFAETVHILFGIVMVTLMIRAIMRGKYDAAAGAVIANLIVNIYPTLVQRYNRQRILRLLNQDTRTIVLQQLRSFMGHFA
jgi:hypothetical protein